MKRFRIYALLLLTSCLSSCSWQEYFTIFNKSGASVEVRYEINLTDYGLSLFSTDFRAFQTTRNGGIDWNKPVRLLDADVQGNSVSVFLPDNAALIIGELSNDHYSQHDQQFINDLVFNLVSIEVPEKSTVISPQEFDTHFKKKNGIIGYEIR